MSIPEDLRYSEDHEWVRSGNGSSVRVGITQHAANEMGDIVYVSLPTVGEEVAVGDACGELESTKSVSDVLAPVAGVVISVNEILSGAPETVNLDPYGDGWLFDIELASDATLDDLLDADAYAELVGD